MPKLVKVAIIGASGYSGEQLVRYLLGHAAVEIVCVTSRQNAGKTLSEVFPRFSQAYASTEQKFIEPDVKSIIASGAEVAFLALPHGVAAEFAIPLLAAGIRVIDLSADFRLRSADTYREFYEHEHPAPDLLIKAVYGLPEIRRQAITKAELIASPGCYPTSILLPLIPLLKAKVIDPNSIRIFSMSGVSGAGRKESIPLLFCECNESVRAYSVPKHRQLSEIEQELSLAADQTVVVTFTPHLIPVNAGICTTIYADALGAGQDLGEVYTSAYGNAPFVRLRGRNACPDTKHVMGTNFVDIGWSFDNRTQRYVLMSAEDNIGKGAGAQAVQSFNLMFDLPETMGLLVI